MTAEMPLAVIWGAAALGLISLRSTPWGSAAQDWLRPANYPVRTIASHQFRTQANQVDREAF